MEIISENQISCLVEQGIIYSKRDMIRILRDLDRVLYVDLIDNASVANGEGYVVEVYANSYDSTLVFNHRLHINVNSFDFLKITSQPDKLVELISGHRIIKLKPLTNILLANQSHIEEAIDEQRITIASQLACDDEVDLNYYRE
ncbi:MAG: hypothetical protein A3I68_05755 [Candidatus Melainabacteria bacterium RIFCSPLOWO2_02_FULL_35_15]|nr:MAG: hypothetical protein A3F80_00595 [Candidatus Melainabacteria bacterium RIFCSPLOWO2_12_FULL_35_11]OGI13873.1 MAG: hypothetical protein A3I68_05755 [Candidatus Melainabacteria bacterium RIFCSPLOWO2_02_FULL_35_15]